MKKTLYFIMGIVLMTGGCKSGTEPAAEKIIAVIPAPVSITELKGEFVFSEKSKIILSVLDDETKLAADCLAKLVSNPAGIDLPVEEGKKASKGSVFMILDTAVQNDEGYLLTVTAKSIVIRAKSAVGLFYAVQTIRQLMPVEVESPSIIE